MYKRTAVLLSICLFSLFPLLWFVHSASSQSALPAAPAVPDSSPTANIIIQRNTNGVLATNNQAVFGPLSCSSMGDPYSPLNPNWAGGEEYTGLYTYRYRINIPADYPHDVVRLELFDPDSINKLNNTGSSYTTAVTHTAAWIASGRPAVETLSCSGSNINPCLINTRELDYLGLPLDQVNLWWFVRIDENRTGNGSGTGCGSPGSYTPSYNTQTRYELTYWAPTEDAYPLEILLARYTGQVGDGVRDSGDHLTDMQWVSPGGQPAFDQPAPVPTEFGSFEVDLTQDTPDIIIDPVTGGRSLYLNVTAVSGASENGWDIWAGPPDYVSTISSDVNTRNIQVLNNPASHDSDGIEVFALNAAPSNSNFTNFVNIPLLDVGAEYAGQDIYVTLFDADSGATPPTTFFFDTVAEEDWGLVFGSNPAEHPDNAPDYVTNGRCAIGSCNNMWVTPPYKITIPTFDAVACTAEPDNQAVCTPFYGGRLIARYRGGINDTYTWQIRQLEPAPQPEQGCTAFPIAPTLGLRSVDEAFYTGMQTQVSYPSTLPSYHSFVDHVPNMPMLNAEPGYVYSLNLAQAQAYWLRWNSGINQSGDTLANSLIWPGNTHDYTDHGDSGVPVGPYPYVVRGFMEVGDTDDQMLNLNDHVSVNLGADFTNIPVQAALQEQIDLNRILRLPLLEANAMISYLADGTPYVEVEQFGLFRIIGYSDSNDWLLLSFAGWDTSTCGEAEPVSSISISGPDSGYINTSYTFTAAVSPSNAALPITTTWAAAGQETITETGGGITTHSLAWSTSGVKTITVTAQNSSSGPVTATHQITITSPANLTIGPLELATTPPITASEPAVFRTSITNTGEVDINSQFYVDVFINPTEIFDEYIPLDESSGYTAVSGLAAGSAQVVTITAPFGFPPDVVSHTVYAMVDSLNQITEPDELDNISEPLTVTHILPPAPVITVTPACSSGPAAIITVHGAYWPVDEPILIYLNGSLKVQILAHDGSFSSSWTQSIVVGMTYQILVMSPSHSASATLTTPCQPAGPGQIAISGPTVGHIGEPLTFVATVDSITAVQPLTYTWYLPDGSSLVHSNGLTDTLTLTENTPGLHGLAVQVENEYGQGFERYSFEIVEHQIFLPLVAKPACEQHTAALTLDYEPTAVSVNDPLTITVTLENVGCADMGLPQYRLTASPALVDPAAPAPIIHYLGLGPGDSDSVEFLVTAVSPGSFTLNANASFEVHLGYPGPAYWGAAAASRQITINP